MQAPRFGTAMISVLLLAGVTACSGSGDDEEPAAAGSPAGTAGGTAGETDGEQVLNVWLYQEPRQFNPLLSKHGPDEQLMTLVFDYLFRTSPDGELQGSLAESWEVSDDARTYTIELVDAQWSDGEPFTAEDVVFTYTRLANPEISAFSGNFANVAGVQEFVDGNADSISGLRAEDERTLVVELVEPNSAWAEQMASSHYILPEHILGDVPVGDLLDHQFFNEPTVALGPYEFVQRQQGQHIELVRNESYRTEVAIDRMYLVEGDSDVATAQLETGDLDLAFVSPTDVERLEQVDGLVVDPAPGVGQVRLAIATDGEVLDDKLVRQAIMHGIDREGIVGQVLQGYGGVYDIPFIGPDWVVPDDLGSYDYDPDRARQLLDEAGWDESTTVTLNIIPGTRDRDTTAEIIQGQLGEIGMNIEINQMEVGPFIEAHETRDFDLSLYGGGIQHVHPNLDALPLMCDQAQPNGPNNSAYCNEQVDQLFADGMAATEQAEKERIYQELSRILFDEVPYIWLYSPELIWVHSERLQGFEPVGDFGTGFWNAAEWSISEG